MVGETNSMVGLRPFNSAEGLGGAVSPPAGLGQCTGGG